METKKYNIKLDGIDIIEKSLFRADVKEHDIFNFDIKIQSLINPEVNLLVMAVNVEVRLLNTKELLAKVLAGIGFFVDDLKNIFDKTDNGSYRIPKELEDLFKSISISTMRGILYSEFRGTALNRAVLPIIDPSTMSPVEGSLIN